MKKIFTVLVFIISSCFIMSQDNNNADTTVSTYLHVKGNWAGINVSRDSLIGFILKNVDSSGKSNWQSGKITDFEKDSGGFFIKANIPSYVPANSDQIWCTAIFLKPVTEGFDTVKIKYGGTKLSRIKLILKSSPEGAEAYLVPNRIWMEKFENTSWEQNDSKIQKFRVNTSSTDTYAFVDETVFVVLFKMKDEYKLTIHYTKPAGVEQEQTVWIKF